ncbi:MAG TPA: hypothetical protein PKV55_12770 [Nitrospira sp.]|jgi:hypothetical protein|nr:hypothetical protein [Nitrospira sp.]MCC7473609.1 hypothetical protein [Candidatus Nomurabacteria bacterium]MBS0180098.1 hypothetical protein [Nitrospira sp.]HMZ54524.1 hypothetical protein [Nitrospira sp.]HNA27620.1 hypothetical protein [Nitrospira sp.]
MNRILAWSMTVGLLTLAGCVNQEIHEYSPKWDSWMGSSKDDRIKEMGIPTRCHTFKEGGEVCEWMVPLQDGRQDLIGLTFTPKGQVCQWSYRGFYGMQKSKQSC